MAAPLSRLSRNFLRKNHLQLSRLASFPFTENHFLARDRQPRKNESPNSEGAVKNWLTYTALISGCGYILYKWKFSTERFMNPLSIVYPVHALSSGISHNRDKYNFIADVVEISAPSVVYIEIEDRKRVDFITGKSMIVSNGSGFIVGEDGLILTNAHVVVNKPNTVVKVRLHDGNTYSGAVETVDLQSDLATVRIKKSNLPVMKLGSSSSIRPGEFVVAIGSPLSLSNTITSGVVSSASRHSKELGLHHKHMDYIQTDAAVTFGNSGGPLVNLNGEAIGINAMKITPGISFAIPIDYAKDFLKKGEARRKDKGVENMLDTPKRRYLGLTMLTLTPDIIFVMQQRTRGSVPANVRHGVLVWKVIVGSPAHNAGLLPGDIITHVNDEPVVSAANIYNALEKSGSLKFTVARKEDILQLEIEAEDV